MKNPNCKQKGCFPIGICESCKAYIKTQGKVTLMEMLFKELEPFGVTRIDCNGVIYSRDITLDNSRVIN